MDTICSRMRTEAQKRLEHVAIIEHGQLLSYRWLITTIQALVALLVEAGARRGTRVALVLPNGAEFVTSFFAVAHVGGIVIPLNPALREAELVSIMEDAKVSLVLTVGKLRYRCVCALYSAVGLREGSVIVVEEPGQPSKGSAERMLAVAWPPEWAMPNDPVLYLYSSGSTGRPKRIVRNHFNLLFETDRLIEVLRLSASDRFLGAAPFSHTNGLMRSMVASMLSGATLVPIAQFERRAIGRLIEDHDITVFIGVPFMFAMLAETRWPRPVDFSSLRLCLSSSAPLLRVTSQRFYEQYTIHVRQLYGTTETGSISVNLSPRPEEFWDSVGNSLDGVDVAIFSEDRRVLPPGEVGEIGIRTPGAAWEYPGLPDQTKAAFWNGYFFPADIVIYRLIY